MSSPLRLRCVLFGTGQIVRFTGKARRIRRALRRRLVQPVSSTQPALWEPGCNVWRQLRST